MKQSKFRPKISRVKLNSEQAVLACNCYGLGHRSSGITDLYYGPHSSFSCISGLGHKGAWGSVPGGCHSVPNQQHAVGGSSNQTSS